jgi:hypothetical protein
MSARIHQRPWDMTGGALWFDREQWGVVVDALAQHRGHATERKSVNPASNSDERAEMCAEMIRRINEAAS